MNEEIENDLERLKLKYSDADVECVLNSILGDSNNLEVKSFIMEEFQNNYISKIERENGKV